MTASGGPPAGSVRDWVERRACDTPDAVSHLFSDGSQELSYSELRTDAARVARRLKAAGAVRGESVATFLNNSRDAVLVLFGILLGGFRATPMNLAASAEAHRFALRHSGARFAVVGADEHTSLDEAGLDGLAVIDAESLAGSRTMPESTESGFLPAAGDPALLMYTSGTTGRPKGVLHCHRSLLAGGWTTATAHRLGPQDRALCVLPHFHINGLCVTLMAPLVSGGSVIVCPRFSVQRFWEDCLEHEATWFSVVPTIISRLLHHDAEPHADAVRRLRFGRSASSALPPDVHRAFEARFGVAIIETMGLTETAAQILANPLPPAVRKLGSPGVAFGNEVAILDGGGCILGPGEAGEIAVRGPNVMEGYLDDEEATGQTIMPEGWLRTGDLGHVDGDGYVYVTGRLKELIIKGGENIAPREIDDVLYAHPDVVEAAAFAQPCSDYGQRVEAAVRLRKASTVTVEQLVEHCRAKVGAFRAPDRIHVLETLPKGPSGKIQRNRLPDLV